MRASFFASRRRPSARRNSPSSRLWRCAMPSLPWRRRSRRSLPSNGRTMFCSQARSVPGILIEGEVEPGGGVSVVIGIGVNCASHPPAAAYPATDLRAHGADITPHELFQQLSATMCRRIAHWDRGRNFPAILADWLAAARGVGEEITVRNGAGEKHGRFVGLDQSGRLILELRDGGTEKISAGDMFPIRSSRQPARSKPAGLSQDSQTNGAQRTRLRAARRHRRDRDEPLDLRLWRCATPAMAHRRLRRVVCVRGAVARRRSDPAGHQLSDRGAQKHRRSRADPRSRRPYGRADRSMAAP